MSYEFKGWDWSELAECWGVTVEEKPVNAEIDSEVKELFKSKETIDIIKLINGMKIVFTVNDEEEVLAEKIKMHIYSNLDYTTASFKDKQMRVDIEDFLKALIKFSKDNDYNYPVYEGMLKVENDFTLAKWICHNLEMLWT